MHCVLQVLAHRLGLIPILADPREFDLMPFSECEHINLIFTKSDF